VRDFIGIAKALADPNRVRALLALRDRELCVCQIVELLDLAPSTVSKHMSLLRQVYLVDSRKDGRWTYYRRPGREAPGPVRAALRWIDASLSDAPDAREDTLRLEKILEIPLEEFCKLSGRSLGSLPVHRTHVPNADGRNSSQIAE